VRGSDLLFVHGKPAERPWNVTEPLPTATRRAAPAKAPISEEEKARLRILALYEILDTPPEEVFDEITDLAAQICACPMAGISITDENRQWFKSRVGIRHAEVPRDFGARANKPLTVEDTKHDKQLADNPVVAGLKVRFYAGMPLLNKEGFVMGTLLVMDRKPRRLSVEQVFALEALSRQIVTLLELRRALAERSVAETEVIRLNQALERRVEERTAQLKGAYESLKAEIEDRERLQNQMLQIQKMEAVGRLAGGIAHDFNNILLVINGYSDMLVSGAVAPESQLNFLQEIQKAGRRGASLTRQLLTFSRRQVIEPRVFNLNDTVAGMSGMFKRLIGESIKLVAKKNEMAHTVRADEGQVEQVIMNLVINACDAMPEGGRLELETSYREVASPIAYEGGEIVPMRYTVLTVRDSGTGMTPEVKARMFEPFFTTKPEGKGTGLGLATCFGIVQQSGGHITCDTAPGQGTTFEVYLPAPELSSTAAVTGKLPTAAVRGKETILLVEDDDAVRKLACLMLESFGYQVIEAQDGTGALALVHTLSQVRIDLLLSDLNMPNMTGRELAERLSLLRPGIKCMLMSGNTDDGLVYRGGKDQATQFLQKPFTPEQLSKSVRDVLDQPSAK